MTIGFKIGWSILIGFIGLVIAFYYYFNNAAFHAGSPSQAAVRIILTLAITTGLILLVCLYK